jgi:hypothetical protein
VAILEIGEKTSARASHHNRTILYKTTISIGYASTFYFAMGSNIWIVFKQLWCQRKIGNRKKKSLTQQIYLFIYFLKIEWNVIEMFGSKFCFLYSNL